MICAEKQSIAVTGSFANRSENRKSKLHGFITCAACFYIILVFHTVNVKGKHTLLSFDGVNVKGDFCCEMVTRVNVKGEHTLPLKFVV